MSRRTFKKLLLSLVTIGALASITTGGTYAVFKSEEDNLNGNTASGTLTLNNLVGASSCDSQASSGTGTSANYNTKESSPASVACTALFTTAQFQYPGTWQTVRVTLKNTGSVDAANLSLFMPLIQPQNLSCITSATPGATVVNGGDPCSATTPDGFYVEEDNSSWTALSCKYPAGAAPCSGLGGTLNGFSSTYYAYVGHKLDLGTEPNQSVGLKAQDSRYFTIGIEEGDYNALQGETATFSLTWHLDSN